MQIRHPVESKKRPGKKRPSGQKKAPTIQLTRKRLLLWLGLACLAMVWMFILGVLVGRDLSPVHFDVQKLKNELVALKREAFNRDQARLTVETDNPSGNPDLDFYKILTDKKEEALSRFTKAHEQTAKHDAISPESSKSTKTAGQGLLTIQVASLNSAGKAGEMVADLRRKGYEAYETMVSVPGKGTYHRVRVGHFSDSTRAGRVAARLKQEKFETLIVRE